ncbi:phytol kinase 1, chloroplastic isoform X1 [Cynara cardunculus var. scolymus]|uniref:phytol kinase 1, chloroplastic isoform X1 n=1 Tax=Cynara cardunculus var. scolymus TaxID=59895 RepID=UPI000D624179|nr:phytol kinase 1, chloroplastic isoform X1 [Cynara cardunculus var. scolymus]
MASTPHSSISAVVATTAANLKLSLLRNQFCPRRHDFRPRLDRIWNTSVDVHNQRRLLLLLPPRNVRSTAFAVNVSGPLLQDAGATVLVVAGAYALVAGFDNLTQRQIIEQNLSRKLVHILSGLLYMGCWPIFSTSTEARYFAAVVPLLNFTRLLVHGLSLVTNEDLIKSVTREGKPEELLRGPLYYVLVLILSSLVFWRESPVGVISLSMMCGGDGIADIMGRRFGFHKIPYNKHKSWAGSISMFIVGFLISIGMLYYFSIFGYFELDWVRTVERVAMVAMVATLVESLPTNGGLDDNISVPLVSMVTAYLSFGF